MASHVLPGHPKQGKREDVGQNSELKNQKPRDMRAEEPAKIMRAARRKTEIVKRRVLGREADKSQQKKERHEQAQDEEYFLTVTVVRIDPTFQAEIAKETLIFIFFGKFGHDRRFLLPEKSYGHKFSIRAWRKAMAPFGKAFGKALSKDASWGEMSVKAHLVLFAQTLHLAEIDMKELLLFDLRQKRDHRLDRSQIRRRIEIRAKIRERVVIHQILREADAVFKAFRLKRAREDQVISTHRFLEDDSPERRQKIGIQVLFKQNTFGLVEFHTSSAPHMSATAATATEQPSTLLQFPGID